MNAEEREDMKSIYEAAKQCQREPHIPKDPIVAEWINQFVKLYEHSEEQAARLAELEEREKRRSERIRQLDQENTNLCKAFSEDTGKQLGRIKELEDKLRWRDCKSEPPTKGGVYIVKQAEDGQPWFDIFRVDIGWENAWNGGPVPHSWRPIE